MSPDWPPACWVAPDLLDPMMSPMNPCFQLQYLAALPEMHSAGPETKMRDTCRHCWLAKACLLLLFLLCRCRLIVITHPGLLQVHCATQSAFHRHTAKALQHCQRGGCKGHVLPTGESTCYHIMCYILPTCLNNVTIQCNTTWYITRHCYARQPLIYTGECVP